MLFQELVTTQLALLIWHLVFTQTQVTYVMVLVMEMLTVMVYVMTMRLLVVKMQQLVTTTLSQLKQIHVITQLA